MTPPAQAEGEEKFEGVRGAKECADGAWWGGKVYRPGPGLLCFYGLPANSPRGRTSAVGASTPAR